jgi:hypothetical protein
MWLKSNNNFTLKTIFILLEEHVLYMRCITVHIQRQGNYMCGACSWIYSNLSNMPTIYVS